MNALGEIAGEICKIVLPIREDIAYGNPRSTVAVCTLSSMSLLRDASHPAVLEKCAIVGRLLSENKGIDALIRYVNKNPNLDTLILCGNEVSGHRAGHALLCLYSHGIDAEGRIINSVSPDPVLSVSQQEVEQFQKRIKIINMIGITRLESLLQVL